jgi:hypothetical protein
MLKATTTARKRSVFIALSFLERPVVREGMTTDEIGGDGESGVEGVSAKG